MADSVPQPAVTQAEVRAAEDAQRAQKLVEEAEKRRRREQEEREKALTAESRRRAQSTSQNK